MKLETRKEAIQAMLDGKTVIDANNITWSFDDDLDSFMYNQPNLCHLNDIVLPCIIKEEPEILYEVAAKENGRYRLGEYLFTEDKIDYPWIKVRAFIVVDGQLKEHKA